LTRDDANIPLKDESLLKDIPEDVIVIRTKAWDLSAYPGIFGLAGKFINRKILIPDSERLWEIFSRKTAEDIIRSHNIDLIYTTSLPYSSHLMAIHLKKKFPDIPWVADFRDEWTNNPYILDNPYNPIRINIERKMEHKVLQTADYLITNTPVMLMNFTNNNPGMGLDMKFYVIPNGYDPDDFKYLFDNKAINSSKTNNNNGLVNDDNAKCHVVNNKHVVNDDTATNGAKIIDVETIDVETKGPHCNGRNYNSSNNNSFRSTCTHKFTITYTGAFYGRRKPDIFFQAIGDLVKNGKINRNKIHIKLMGSFKKEQIQRLTDLHNLNGVVEIFSYVPHEECLKHMISSDCLLLIEGAGPGAEAFYTGKVFEYMVAGRPILAIIPAKGAAAWLIRETSTGLISDCTDLEGTKNNIELLYNAWLKDENIYFPNKEEIRKYERNALTARLVEVFKKAIQI
jgi:glycosyltransferase involved in cell wall biosynthesis